MTIYFVLFKCIDMYNILVLCELFEYSTLPHSSCSLYIHIRFDGIQTQHHSLVYHKPLCLLSQLPSCPFVLPELLNRCLQTLMWCSFVTSDSAWGLQPISGNTMIFLTSKSMACYPRPILENLNAECKRTD